MRLLTGRPLLALLALLALLSLLVRSLCPTSALRASTCSIPACRSARQTSAAKAHSTQSAFTRVAPGVHSEAKVLSGQSARSFKESRVEIPVP